MHGLEPVHSADQPCTATFGLRRTAVAATQSSGRETSRARIAADVLIPARSGCGTLPDPLRWPEPDGRLGGGLGAGPGPDGAASTAVGSTPAGSAAPAASAPAGSEPAAAPEPAAASESTGVGRDRRRLRRRGRRGGRSGSSMPPRMPDRGHLTNPVAAPGGSGRRHPTRQTAVGRGRSTRPSRLAMGACCVSCEEAVNLFTFAPSPSQDGGRHLRVAPGGVPGREAGDLPDGPGHTLVPETRNEERRPFDLAGPNHHGDTRLSPGRAPCPTGRTLGVRFDGPVTVM